MNPDKGPRNAVGPPGRNRRAEARRSGCRYHPSVPAPPQRRLTEFRLAPRVDFAEGIDPSGALPVASRRRFEGHLRGEEPAPVSAVTVALRPRPGHRSYLADDIAGLEVANVTSHRPDRQLEITATLPSTIANIDVAKSPSVIRREPAGK